MLNFYMGIDPGKSGGISVIDTEKGVEYQPMPSTRGDIWRQIDCGVDTIQFCCIEKVWSFPGQGVTSAFTFGKGYGELLGFLTAADIPSEEIPPRKWQKEFGIKPRDKKKETQPQFKERLRGMCQQLFPNLSVWEETLTKQRSVCDAILIAEYCRRIHSD